jgi:hypothetical protein
MHVDVEHGLAGGLAVVDDEAEAFGHKAKRLRDAPCRDEDVAHHEGVVRFNGADRLDMQSWNDEHMGRRDRANVPERDDMLVFVDDVGGDFSVDDAAEETTHASELTRQRDTGAPSARLKNRLGGLKKGSTFCREPSDTLRRCTFGAVAKWLGIGLQNRHTWVQIPSAPLLLPNCRKWLSS